MIVVGGIAAAALILGSAVWWWRRRWTVMTIDGPSMAPTYRSGDRVAVRRCRPADVVVGEIVVFHDPTGGGQPPLLIKRVVALGGDPTPASVHRAMVITANADSDRLSGLLAEEPAPVPPGHLVVLSDAGHGTDSRSFGYLPVTAVEGIVVRRLASAPEPAA